MDLMLVEPLCWSGGPSDGGAKPTIFVVLVQVVGGAAIVGEGVVALNLVDRCQVLQESLLPGVLGGHAVGQGGARHVESGAVEVEAYRVEGGVRGRLLSGGLGG